MGANASQLEKDIGSDLFPANEHYFGLVCIIIHVVIASHHCPHRHNIILSSVHFPVNVHYQFIIVSSPSILSKEKLEILNIFKYFQVNFGNTCYSNSVLQALYFCRPFREKVLKQGPDISLNIRMEIVMEEYCS